jgi:hypothetical protein
LAEKLIPWFILFVAIYHTCPESSSAESVQGPGKKQGRVIYPPLLELPEMI